MVALLDLILQTYKTIYVINAYKGHINSKNFNTYFSLNIRFLNIFVIILVNNVYNNVNNTLYIKFLSNRTIYLRHDKIKIHGTTFFSRFSTMNTKIHLLSNYL